MTDNTNSEAEYVFEVDSLLTTEAESEQKAREYLAEQHDIPPTGLELHSTEKLDDQQSASKSD